MGLDRKYTVDYVEENFGLKRDTVLNYARELNAEGLDVNKDGFRGTRLLDDLDVEIIRRATDLGSAGVKSKREGKGQHKMSRSEMIVNALYAMCKEYFNKESDTIVNVDACACVDADVCNSIVMVDDLDLSLDFDDFESNELTDVHLQLEKDRLANEKLELECKKLELEYKLKCLELGVSHK